MGTATQTKAAMTPIVRWQYQKLETHCALLEEHLSDPTCPCKTAGEACPRKHLRRIEDYCAETIIILERMGQPNPKLFELMAEAKTYREAEEANLCGKKAQVVHIEWAAKWRKYFESLLVGTCAVTKVALKQCSLAQAPIVTISGKCGSSKACSFKVKGSLSHEARTGAISALPGLIDRLSKEVVQVVTARCNTTAIGPTGTRYNFEYRVVDADDLIVSHDPFTFEPNPVYAQKLQPRIRDRAATQVQVQTIAANLDPEQLLLDFRALDRGAPIVGPDMLVESGNGRLMGLKRAIVEHHDVYHRYLEAMLSIAEGCGLTEADIKKHDHPVLVRIRLTDVPDRAKFAKEANDPPAIEMSAIEKAKGDAGQVTAEMLAGLEVGDQTIEEALRSPANRQFAQAFLAKLPANVQAGLVDSDGVLNQDGIRRMVRALFVRALPGEAGLTLAERFFESTDPFVRNVFNGLAASLAPLARIEVLTSSGQREREYAIADDLSRTIPVYAKIKISGSSVERYLAQQQLESRELNRFQERVLTALDANARSGKRIGGILRRYAELVIESPPPQQASMVIAEKPTKAILWSVAEKSVATVAQSAPCSYLAKRANVNMTPEEFRAVCDWRPLREFIAWATSVGKVKVWAVGLVPGSYQVSVTTPKGTANVLIDEKAKKIPHVRQVRSLSPNETVFEVVLPGEEKPELAWSPQVVEAIHGERGQQASLFQFRYADYKPDPMIISNSEPFGVKGIIPDRYKHLKVETRLSRPFDFDPEKTPMVKSPQDVQPFLESMRTADREHILAVYLDTAHHVVGLQALNVGTEDQSLVAKNNIFRSALLTGATSVILAHNHPSGRSDPSAEDRRVFESLSFGCGPLDVKVLDMLVVGAASDYSIVGGNSYPVPGRKADKKPEGSQASLMAPSADRFRSLADALQKEIDAKRDPGTAHQNPTRRRAGIIDSMAKDADRLEEIQSAMRGIAGALESGALPPILSKVSTGADVEAIRDGYWHLPYIHRTFIEDIREAISTFPGWQHGKEVVAGIENRMAVSGDNRATVDEHEAKVLKELFKAHLPKTATYALADIVSGQRFLAMGLDSKEKFEDAQSALKVYISGPAPEVVAKAKERELTSKLIGVNIPGFFPSPPGLIDRMLTEADLRPGMSVLEPSAGKGDIADAVKKACPECRLVVNEYNQTLVEILRAKGYLPSDVDFLEYSVKPFDRILMNPPFEHGQDVDHVRHAFDLLKPGGRLVAIMGEHCFFGQEKKCDDFRFWLYQTVKGKAEQLPEGSFTGEGAFRATGIRSRLVVLNKAPDRSELVEPVSVHRAGEQIRLFQRKQGATLGQNATLERERPIPREQIGFDFLGRVVEPPAERPQTSRATSPAVSATGEAPTKKFELFPFQKEGVAWLKGRKSSLLADDMGLGKTPQAIHWGADVRPVLVVAPTALIYNWQREISNMWRPGDSTLILDGKMALPDKLPDWTILSYGMLERYVPGLRRAGFRAIIIDEAHQVKNLKAQRTQNLLELVRPKEPEPDDQLIPFRLAVTGTPILNRPIELFALLVFLGFKDRWQYKDFVKDFTETKRIAGRTIFTGSKNLDTLNGYLGGFMLRRLKKDVLTQLPPKISTPLFVGITNADEYRRAETNFISWVTEKKGDEAAMNAARAEIITRMNGLRQLAAEGKVLPVCDWLKPCDAQSGKVLVFSQFVSALESLYRCKPGSVLYTGVTSAPKRQAIVDEFQREVLPCFFLGTTGAAGVGITLTQANRVAFLDLPWTPGGKTQAEDRAHRIGQTKAVEVVNVLARGTIDERMLELLSDKEKVIAQAVDGKTKDEAQHDSIASGLLNSYLRAPYLANPVMQYEGELQDPDVDAVSFEQGQLEILEGLRQEPKHVAEGVRISGKCEGGQADSCQFSVKPDVKAIRVTGVTDMEKAIRGMTGDKKLEDPILATIAAQIGLMDRTAAKRCTVVGRAVHCQIEPSNRFDPDSFRMVKAVHGSKLPEGVTVRIGCPKGEFDHLNGCKVGTRGQAVIYAKAVCGKHEGCKLAS